MLSYVKLEGIYDISILSVVFLFLLQICVVAMTHPGMFIKKHGRRHSITGFLYLIWIFVGYAHCFFGFVCSIPLLLFDITLGILGTVLTLTAAFEFQHKHVKNLASGIVLIF